MKQIVVLNRSWNVVGDIETDGDFYIITNGSVIRRWGTTKGLGELNNGPLPETVLDPVERITAHRDQVIFRMDINQDKWK